MKYIITTKTVFELMEEVRGKIRYFSNKYENYLSRNHRFKKYDPSLVQSYRRCKDTYFEIFIVLQHLSSYSKLIDHEKCNSCRFDINHVLHLREYAKKWSSLIIKCKDGFRYKKELDVLTKSSEVAKSS